MHPSQKTSYSSTDNNDRDWFIVDATGHAVGRLASRIALVLQGKHKPSYSPHIDDGDYVIVIHCEKAIFTGKKAEQKVYRHHTLYPGGLKETGYHAMMNTHPDRVISEAVRKMLPRNKLTSNMMKKLRVVVGENHEYGAQQPVPLDLGIDRKGA